MATKKRRTPGERLKDWREETGTSQARAAELVGVRQSAWSDWENDKAAPHVEHALKIERVTCGACPVSAWASGEAA